MRPYRDHVAEQLAAAAAAAQGDPRAGIMDDSLAGRYLRAASDIEKQSAKDFLSKVRGGSEEEALAAVIRDRRGSAVDLVVTAVCANTAKVLGRVAGRTVNPVVAMVPGVVAIAAGFLVKQSYQVRSGLFWSGDAWLSGVVQESSNKGS